MQHHNFHAALKLHCTAPAQTMTKKVTTPRKKKKKTTMNVKPKMTKEERRLKYTALAVERRDAKAQRQRARHLTCFQCRQKGHLASSCPEASSSDNKICYKCGSTEHSLNVCPNVQQGERIVEMDLPYATCFICHVKGHLASQCQRNERGIYVNGGSCRTCGSTKHRANDCPEKKTPKHKSHHSKEPTEEEEARANEALLNGQGDEQPEQKREAKVVHKKRRVVKF